LSPVEQSRELNPLDATLDAKPQKEAVEMCLDRSLGDVEVPSNFRVVASLKQQIDDLPFPGPYLAEFFFHKHCTCPTRPGRRKWLVQPGPWTHLDSGLCVSFCIRAAKARLER
jgi:hypothetical protein